MYKTWAKLEIKAVGASSDWIVTDHLRSRHRARSPKIENHDTFLLSSLGGYTHRSTWASFYESEARRKLPWQWHDHVETATGPNDPCSSKTRCHVPCSLVGGSVPLVGVSNIETSEYPYKLLASF